MRFLALIPFIPFLLVTACAHDQKEFQTTNCNQEIGYEHGYNDAKDEKPMDSSFFGKCEPEGRRVAMLGYREGYESFRKAKEGQGISADESGIRVKVPGVNINLPSKSAKAWACELEAEGKVFQGVGPTKVEAGNRARESCRSQIYAKACTTAEPQCAENK